MGIRLFFFKKKRSLTQPKNQFNIFIIYDTRITVALSVHYTNINSTVKYIFLSIKLKGYFFLNQQELINIWNSIFCLSKKSIFENFFKLSCMHILRHFYIACALQAALLEILVFCYLLILLCIVESFSFGTQ